MYYEVYIDIMFFVNFMMDVFVLLSVKTLLKLPGSVKRVIVGALAGAGMSCLVVVLQLSVWIQLVMTHLLVSSAMLVIGLKIRSFSEFLKSYIVLYFVSVLLGGILGMLKPYVKYTSLYFAVVIACYYTIRAVWEFLCQLQKEEQKLCRIVLYQDKNSCEICGLWDTGNVLRDPQSKKLVSILERSTMEKLIGTEEARKDSPLIPYRTVGKPVSCRFFDKKCILYRKNSGFMNRWSEYVEEQISEQGMYQMIINPEILGGRKDGCKSSNAAAV